MKTKEEYDWKNELKCSANELLSLHGSTPSADGNGCKNGLHYRNTMLQYCLQIIALAVDRIVLNVRQLPALQYISPIPAQTRRALAKYLCRRCTTIKQAGIHLCNRCTITKQAAVGLCRRCTGTKHACDAILPILHRRFSHSFLHFQQAGRRGVERGRKSPPRHFHR